MSEFEWNEKITEHGWAVEFMAIMDEIFLFPAPGMLIGTDAEYNDNDHQTGREHKVISFGNTEGSHAHPSYYGRSRPERMDRVGHADDHPDKPGAPG